MQEQVQRHIVVAPQRGDGAEQVGDLARAERLGAEHAKR